jgi:hypothetical protein
MKTQRQVGMWVFLGCLVLLFQVGMAQGEAASLESRGVITFEKFRQFSTGMTEGEILRLAGQPAETYNITCDISIGPFISCPRVWVYFYEEKWVAELTFVSGRVAEVNNFRGQ